MNIKGFLDSILTYKPSNDYDFTLSADSNEFTIKPQCNEKLEVKNLFPTLSVNLEYIKTRFNTLINSDIIIREFTLNARGKQYRCFYSLH